MSKKPVSVTTSKERTFSSGAAAVNYAKALAGKGEISAKELRGVEKTAKASSKRR